jgi:hypothetical protein
VRDPLAADSRRTAEALSARVRQLLEKHRRTREEADEMLHAAHASRHYLGLAGRPADLVRAEWQCARVYSTLGRAEPALYHARRCVELCEDVELEPHELARAYESVAHAAALAGDRRESQRYEHLARLVGAHIMDNDERDRLLADLSAIARLRMARPLGGAVSGGPWGDPRTADASP